MMITLSLFPGIDLLGRGFEAEGYTVVRGPDLLYGGDIRAFHVPAGRFDGVIGGPPCPDFSRKRRSPPTGYGLEMLGEFARVIVEAEPDWWLMENVPSVPNVEIDGYSVQRFDLNARECGLRQSRLRHFQFGSRRGLVVVPERLPPRPAMWSRVVWRVKAAPLTGVTGRTSVSCKVYHVTLLCPVTPSRPATGPWATACLSQWGAPSPGPSKGRNCAPPMCDCACVVAGG